jgi:O-glycosyl hydrolase
MGEPQFSLKVVFQMKQRAWGVAGIAQILSLALAPALLAQAPARITIDPAQRFQYIDGFGVNFNGTYFRDAQKPLIDMLIDDLGATIFRLDPYGLTNWEAVNDNDDPNTMNWEYYNDRYSTPPFEASWAAARYLNARGIRPYLTLSGVPPEWMLDTKGPPAHKVCREQPSGKPDHLKASMYDEFAETVVSLAVYARTRARIDYEYFGPVNETDCYPAEGPRVDPDEMPKVLGAIARRLRKEGLADVKMVVAEQARITNDYITPIMQSADLMKQVGVFSFHTYGADSVGPQVARLQASEYRNVRVWMTEYGDLSDLDRSAANEWKSFSLAATHRALTALNQGASAALFWDAYDNYHEHYPRLTFYGLVQNADHIYSPKKRYFAAKQLYHFVRPGAQRIGATSDAQSLLVSAFRNGATNAMTVVGVKLGGSNHVQLTVPDAGAALRWSLYETTRELNCVRTEMLSAKNGLVEFDLPEEAIFTLVGEPTHP